MEKISSYILLALGVLCLVILIDFHFKSSVTTEYYKETDSKLEKYYNAGGNSHTSFRVATTASEFAVSEVFIDWINTHNPGVEFTISRSLVFQNVLFVQAFDAGSEEYFGEIYSLNYWASIVIPGLFLLLLLLHFKQWFSSENLLVVMSLLLIVDLVYLLW